jgi:hypothetical protein
MIWLIICDAFVSKRISLAWNDYALTNLHYLSVFKADGIYSVADPRESG